MTSKVANQLKTLIEEYGPALCDDPKRCRALLMDYCGDYKKEVNIMCMALEINVPRELLSSKNTPYKIQRARLAKKLIKDYSMAEEAALWGVDAWAYALGVKHALPQEPGVSASKQDDDAKEENRFESSGIAEGTSGYEMTSIAQKPNKGKINTETPRERIEAQAKTRTQTGNHYRTGVRSRFSNTQKIGLLAVAVIIFQVIISSGIFRDVSNNIEFGVENDQSYLTEKPVIDDSVAFKDLAILDVTADSAWASVYIKTHTEGLFYWEFSDGSISSSKLETEQSIPGESIGMLIEGLLPDTNYIIRPIFEADGSLYKGDWISFSTIVVSFGNISVTEVTSNSAWAEVYLTINSEGLFYWEISDESVSSIMVEFESGINNEPIGTLIEGLQSGTNYRLRPAFATDHEIFFGEWVSFTTR